MLSSSNQIFWLYDNQYIFKDPEADDQVVPVITVQKLDGTIECINNVFKEVALDKPEIVIQIRTILTVSLGEKKRMHTLNMIDIVLRLFTKYWNIIEVLVRLKLLQKKVTVEGLSNNIVEVTFTRLHQKLKNWLASQQD